MLKILVISEALRLPALYVRWKLLAENNPDLDVTIVGPAGSGREPVDNRVKNNSAKVPGERFRVTHINMKPSGLFRWLGIKGWISLDLYKILKDIKPDFIYLIGFEEQVVSLEVGLFKRFYSPGSKIVCFTMRGTEYIFRNKHPLRIIFLKLIFYFTTGIFDAMICHYPEGRKIIMDGRKYKKPVYMQTQIGVDRDIFYPDKKSREEIREKYGITSEFVFGSVSRIDGRKGILDIIEALPEKGSWRYLMIGNGKDMDPVLKKIKQRGLEEHVIVAGYVEPGKDIARHMNALDCFLHVPVTTRTWIDTFPGVVPEAMATALPVIGSDSGAVPYQLGGCGIIVPEGNPEALKREMMTLMGNPEAAVRMGSELYQRVMNTFEIRHLTKCFNIVVRDIMDKKFVEGHVDQASFQFD